MEIDEVCEDACEAMIEGQIDDDPTLSDVRKFMTRNGIASFSLRSTLGGYVVVEMTKNTGTHASGVGTTPHRALHACLRELG